MRTLFLLLISGLVAVADCTPLTRSGIYFKDSAGNVVILRGADGFYETQDPSYSAASNPVNDLAFATTYRLNFTRLWQGAQTFDVTTNTFPYNRTGPGNATDGLPKFDLTSVNMTYVNQVSNRVAGFNHANVYCSVMLDNGYDIEGVTANWATNCYNSNNNINGFVSGTNNVFTLNTAGFTNAFLIYAKAMVDALGSMPNVMWEPLNESPFWSKAFQEQMMAWIHAYEATNTLYQHPTLYSSFSTVSGTNGNTTLFAYSGTEAVSPYGADIVFSNSPPVVTGSQVQILDTDHAWGGGITPQTVWKLICRGYNPLSMDTQFPTNNGLRNPGRWNLRAAGDLLGRMNSLVPVPSTSVSSSGYALTNTALQYLVHAPSSSTFTVTVPSGNYFIKWIDATGLAYGIEGGFNSTGSAVTLTPPGATNSAAFIGPANRPGGLEFDGTDDRVATGNLGSNTGDTTIMAWIYFRSVSVNQRIFDASTTFFFWVSAVGPPTDVVISDATHDLGGASTLYPYTWYHVAATRTSAGVCNLYVNGALSGTANQTMSTPSAFSSSTFIGNRAAFDRCFDGYIQDVRLYSRVLAAQEIGAIATSRLRYYPNTASLVAYYPMDEGADGASGATTVKDRSLNGHDGTGSRGANTTGLTYRVGGLLHK